MGGCNFGITLSISVPKCHRGKFICSDKKFSNSSEFYYVGTGIHPSMTDIVDAMNTLILERHNHSKNCFTVKMSRRTQKFRNYLANQGSGPAFFSTDLGHIFGSDVGTKLGLILREKGAHKPEFASNIVRIHSPVIYPDLTEYNTVDNTKAPLLIAFLYFQNWKRRPYRQY